MEEAHGLTQKHLQALTASERKRDFYLPETFFRESWMDLNSALGPTALTLLRRVAVVILKPEAFASRRALRAYTFMVRHGFRPFKSITFRFSRLMAHEVWRYQWNKATTDRIRLATMMATVSDSLLILLWDDEPHTRLPAAVRLWGLKGASDPARRTLHHLRSEIGVNNKMIGFIHTCDEPADIIRELGILFCGRTRVELFEACKHGPDTNHIDAVESEIWRITDDTSYHDFDPRAAAARLLAQLHRQSPRTADAADRIRRLVQQAMRGEMLRFHEFIDSLASLDPSPSSWDAMVFAANHIRFEYAQTPPLLDSAEMELLREAWTQAESV